MNAELRLIVTVEAPAPGAHELIARELPAGMLLAESEQMAPSRAMGKAGETVSVATPLLKLTVPLPTRMSWAALIPRTLLHWTSPSAADFLARTCPVAPARGRGGPAGPTGPWGPLLISSIVNHVMSCVVNPVTVAVRPGEQTAWMSTVSYLAKT